MLNNALWPSRIKNYTIKDEVLNVRDCYRMHDYIVNFIFLVVMPNTNHFNFTIDFTQIKTGKYFAI